MRNIRDIARVVALHTSLELTDIMGQSRLQPLAHARFAIYHIARERGHSYPLIGKRMGGRDHSTVLHGVRRAKEIAKRDPAYAAMIADVMAGKAPPAPVFDVRDKVVQSVAPAKRPIVDFKELEGDSGADFHLRVMAGSSALLAALARVA